jgi:hypothetical protein
MPVERPCWSAREQLSSAARQGHLTAYLAVAYRRNSLPESRPTGIQEVFAAKPVMSVFPAPRQSRSNHWPVTDLA